MIYFKCTKCGQDMDAPEELRGQVLKCLNCGFYEVVDGPNPDLSARDEPASIKCPKCGSTQIMGDKKGFSGGKAVAGAIALGPLGILAGLHRSKKIIVSCLNCGYKWSPGEK